MRKKVLLVNPWIYDFAAYDFGIKPVGLLRIASILRYENEVHLIDCLAGCARSKRESGFSKFRKEKIEKPDILKSITRPYFRYGINIEDFKLKLSKIKKLDSIYVTSGMTYWYPGVQLAIKILKDFFPKTPITLGGIYATLCYEHAKENSGADYVWNGDYVKEKGSEVLPAYDLLEDKGMLPVFTSKGCPYKCSYCASRFLNPRFLQRDPVVVFEELTYYMREFGTQKFVFYDDALFYNSKRGIKKLLRIINASGIKFDFYTPNGLHARFVDEELAYMLRKAGFKDLRLSLETSDSRVQRITGNKVSNKDIKRAILLLKEAGFEKKDIGIYILVGAPWLNIEKTRDDIFFINSLGAKAVLVSYSPTPKTKDYEVLIESGIIESDMDPVWHNKAVFSERLMPGMVDEIKSLRRFTAKINETAV